MDFYTSNDKQYYSEDFLSVASKIIQQNIKEFQEYLYNNQKLKAVKRLKELTGNGLKECKEICDLYFDGKLIPIKEERKEKLERLAKLPLVNELIDKFKKLHEDDLRSAFMKMKMDDLLSIDEYLPENKNENENE